MAHFFILTISALLMIVTVADWSSLNLKKKVSHDFYVLCLNVATHVVIFPIRGDSYYR